MGDEKDWRALENKCLYICLNASVNVYVEKQKGRWLFCGCRKGWRMENMESDNDNNENERIMHKED